MEYKFNKYKAISYIINAIAAILIFILIEHLFSLKLINRYYQGIIKLVCINVILAVSLNLTTGVLGELTLGHAGFMAIGAYVSAIFVKFVSESNIMIPEAAFHIGIIFGGLAAALFGIIIGIPTLRLKGDYLAIITLGFGEIIRVIITNLEITGGARGLSRIPRVTTFPYAYFIMVATIVFMFTFGLSRHGRAIRAIRDDAIAAESSGIPTTFYKVLAFCLAAFFAGVAGALYAHHIGTLDPKTFGFNKSIEILVMVVLGGMGSITGSTLSAIVLTLLPELLRDFSEYRMLVYSIVLVLMMIFRPKGLLGTGEISLSALLLKPFKISEQRSVKS